MWKNVHSKLIATIIICLITISCNSSNEKQVFKPNIITTTELISDLLLIIGGEFVSGETLINPGSDPHTYNASERDMIKMAKAQLIIYNGLYLEGRLQEVFNKLNHNTPTLALSAGIDKQELILKSDGSYDPHFWMNVKLLMKTASYMADCLVRLSPVNERIYRKNEELYLINLMELDRYIRNQVSAIPEEKRILVTAHDAFSYLGKEYGFKTIALQGITTASEISSADVKMLIDYIKENNVTVIFAERSVPSRNILTLQSALKAAGHDVTIGGTLYTDTTGKISTPNYDYISMMTYNIDTIANSLKD